MLYIILLLLLVNSISGGQCLNRYRFNGVSVHFYCKDGSRIIDLAVCNGRRDCPDGSDETLKTCHNFYCPPYAFRCSYGACVQGSYECNGVSDCVDSSDELSLNCRGIKNVQSGNCGFDQFECSSGQCVSYYKVCNGPRDCKDGSDETVTQCHKHYCPPYAFRCTYGGCIPGSSRCNGVLDCEDGSDEMESACQNHTVSKFDSDRMLFKENDEDSLLLEFPMDIRK